jgi:hypothetical protein
MRFLEYNTHLSELLSKAIESENDVFILKIYTANDVPHPQVLEALGLVNVNPRLFNPPCQSICIPYK